MTVTSRQLQKPKILGAAEVAKRTIVQSGLSPSAMSRWADVNIIGLLNGKPNRATERVTWIVEACQRVIQLDQQSKLSTAPGAKDVLFRELTKTMKDLHSRVAGYRCAPAVRYAPSTDRCFDVQYQFAGPKEDAHEGHAVAWIVGHIHAVSRIRRCRRLECRKWFFAVTEHQKYCGDTCRQRDASQGESFKEKRRIYHEEISERRTRTARRESKATRAKGKSK